MLVSCNILRGGGAPGRRSKARAATSRRSCRLPRLQWASQPQAPARRRLIPIWVWLLRVILLKVVGLKEHHRRKKRRNNNIGFPLLGGWFKNNNTTEKENRVPYKKHAHPFSWCPNANSLVLPLGQKKSALAWGRTLRRVHELSAPLVSQELKFPHPEKKGTMLNNLNGLALVEASPFLWS